LLSQPLLREPPVDTLPPFRTGWDKGEGKKPSVVDVALQRDDEPDFAAKLGIDVETLERLRGYEKNGVQSADSNKFSEALDWFGKAIAECPKYASAFNNRSVRSPDGRIISKYQ
jgi:hypothetical protein